MTPKRTTSASVPAHYIGLFRKADVPTPTLAAYKSALEVLTKARVERPGLLALLGLPVTKAAHPVKAKEITEAKKLVLVEFSRLPKVSQHEIDSPTLKAELIRKGHLYIVPESDLGRVGLPTASALESIRIWIGLLEEILPKGSFGLTRV